MSFWSSPCLILAQNIHLAAQHGQVSRWVCVCVCLHGRTNLVFFFWESVWDDICENTRTQAYTHRLGQKVKLCHRESVVASLQVRKFLEHVAWRKFEFCFKRRLINKWKKIIFSLLLLSLTGPTQQLSDMSITLISYIQYEYEAGCI